MTEKTTEKPRATRTSKAVVIVQQKLPDEEGEHDGDIWFDDDEFPTIESAKKWIAKYGDSSLTYRVVRAWPALKITVEPNPTRKVVPA